MAGGTAIGGANSATHTMTKDEIGKRITVRVRFTDDEGNTEVVVSEATSAVIPESPPFPPLWTTTAREYC